MPYLELFRPSLPFLIQTTLCVLQIPNIRFIKNSFLLTFRNNLSKGHQTTLNTQRNNTFMFKIDIFRNVQINLGREVPPVWVMPKRKGVHIAAVKKMFINEEVIWRDPAEIKWSLTKEGIERSHLPKLAAEYDITSPILTVNFTSVCEPSCTLMPFYAWAGSGTKTI